MTVRAVVTVVAAIAIAAVVVVVSATNAPCIVGLKVSKLNKRASLTGGQV